MRFGDARPLRDSRMESLSESSSMRLPASTALADFSRSRRTSRPRLWQYQSTNMSTEGTMSAMLHQYACQDENKATHRKARCSRWRWCR